MKPKILVSKNVPAQCLAPYLDEFDFTIPQEAGGAMTYDEILPIIADYDGYFDIDMVADRAVFDAAKKLKVIANFGVGYDKIDWKYATELGIPVLNTPTQVTEATAELGVALIMSTMRGIASYDKEVRRHVWSSPLFSDRNAMIAGSTLGIMGFGRIGKRVCRKCQGLGMQVIYFDQFRAPAEVESEYGVTYRSFDEVLAESDCISVHIPYCPENHHMFGAEAFAKMKPSAYFINSARGKLVDEAALCAALKNGVIKGAGLDVFEEEPKIYEGLLELDNVVMTPHVASLTMRSRIAMCQEALEGLVAVLRGQRPQNAVNPSVFEK